MLLTITVVVFSLVVPCVIGEVQVHMGQLVDGHTFKVHDSQSGCRSTAGIDINFVRFSEAEVEKIVCFSSCCCSGNVAHVFHMPTAFSKTQHYESCRIFLKKSSSPATNTTQPTSTHRYAILYDNINFSGGRHWIDGPFRACRGLSGVELNSIVAIQDIGGLPNPEALSGENYDDTVTFVFFSDYVCSNDKVIGAVVGRVEDLRGIRPKSVQILRTGARPERWGFLDFVPLRLRFNPRR